MVTSAIHDKSWVPPHGLAAVAGDLLALRLEDPYLEYLERRWSYPGFKRRWASEWINDGVIERLRVAAVATASRRFSYSAFAGLLDEVSFGNELRAPTLLPLAALAIETATREGVPPFRCELCDHLWFPRSIADRYCQRP